MKARLILLVVAMASVVAAVAAPAASAAGYVGWSQPASVTCDPIANTIQIQAHISASEAYEKQRVAYQLYLYHANSRTWIPLKIDGSYWHTLIHQRVTWSHDYDIARNMYVWNSFISAEAPTPNLTYGPFNDGTYYVYTRYAWETRIDSGLWVDKNGAWFSDTSPWSLTTGYSRPPNPGYFGACYL